MRRRLSPRRRLSLRRRWSLRGRWSDGIARLVEPVLQPVRRIIPPVAGLDLSFMVVIFLIQWVNQSIVARQMCGVF